MFKSNRNYYGGGPVVMCVNITHLTKYKSEYTKLNRAYITYIPDDFFNDGVPEKIFYSEDGIHYLYAIKKDQITEDMIIRELSLPKDYFSHFDETPDDNGIPPRSIWIYYLNGKLELMPFSDIKSISGIAYNGRCIG